MPRMSLKSHLKVCNWSMHMLMIVRLIWFWRSQSTFFQLCWDGSSSYKARIECVLLKDTMPVRLEPATLGLESSTLLLSYCAHDLSQCIRFPTIWYVRPAKPQISLRIRAVWSEPLLVAWVFYDCDATDWTPFGVSMLRSRLHRLVWVYTCQNVKLLEISCHGSFSPARFWKNRWRQFATNNCSQRLRWKDNHVYLHFHCESLNEPLHLRCGSYLHEQMDLSHTHICAIWAG